MPTSAPALLTFLLTSLALHATTVARTADDAGMRLEFDHVEIHTGNLFAGPYGYKETYGYQDIIMWPCFNLTAPYPAPLVNREARVLYTRTLDESNRPLQFIDTGPIAGVTQPHGPARFVPLSGPMSPEFVTPTVTVRAVAPAARLKALPRSIARLEGELHLDLVDDLESLEFPFPTEPKHLSLAPGVDLQLKPIHHLLDPMCRFQTLLTIDESKRTPGPVDIRLPFVNLIVANRTKHARNIFHPSSRSVESAPDVVLWFDCPTPESPVTLAVQLIKGVHTAELPFAAAGIDLPLSRAPALSNALPRLVCESDDFEIRLLWAQVRATCYADRGLQPSVNLTLKLGVRDAHGSRLIGSSRIIRIDAITDADAKDLLPPGPRPSSEPEEHRSFGPSPFGPPPVSMWSRRGPDYGGYASMIDMPITAIPSPIASIRGTVTFEEVTSDRFFLIRPANAEIRTLLAHRTHLVEWSPLTEPNLRGNLPINDWLQLICIYQPNRDKTGRRFPCINLIEFLDDTGTSIEAEDPPYPYDFENGMVYGIGMPFVQTGASTIRAHVVYETRTRTIPFEFTNVPIGAAP